MWTRCCHSWRWASLRSLVAEPSRPGAAVAMETPRPRPGPGATMEDSGQRVWPPGMKLALERLQELEKNLNDKGLCFGPIQHFAKLAEGVSQLEEARRSIHEILEVETIEASKLRYNLSELPNKLNQEIAASIAAARESKVTELNELKAKVEMMTLQIEALEKEYCRLERENAFLCPVQRKAGARYNDIIFLMNNVMGDRVNKQITLNETYDNIQEKKRKIIDLNKDKHDLKEEMVERRNEYRVKKGDLTEKFTEIHDVVQEQNRVNYEKKNKLDGLKIKLEDLNYDILDQEKITSDLRVQNTLLQKNKTVLQYEHEEKLQKIEELIIKKDKFTDELKILMEYNQQEIENSMMRSSQVQEDIDKVKVINQNLQEKRDSRSEAARKAKEYETETRKRLKSLTDRLESTNDMLNQTEENLSSVRKEIQEFEEMMLSLADKHKDAMEFLNKEMHKYMRKLEKEQQIRRGTQRRRDEISREMLEVKRVTERYLINMSRRLQSFRRKREKQIKQSMNLEKAIGDYAEKNAALKIQVAVEEDALKNMTKNLLKENKDLKDGIKEVNERIMQVKKELELNLPIQQKLDSDLAEATAICNERGTEFEGQLSKKFSFDRNIARLKGETANLLASLPDLQSKLSTIRHDIFYQVKCAAEQLNLLEVEIYEADRRLELVQIENCKLKLCNFQLTKDLASLEEEGERQKAEKEKQDNELQTIHDNLMKSWALDFSVQMEFGACDQSVLNVIEQLMNKIQLREIKLGSIGDQLKDHLSNLLAFVGSTPSKGKQIQ
ncbi:coiled-coil domain-containing protein 175 [Amblyraja radiata]|uniref:coiled-coil domain-containing protein 175 n=1 Tax=Amblyraja radiata TaxID=386614 RepID=UPI00140342E8|nr:coiled-coil domain-containing protein 175 [Amblyraja radiata]